VLEVHMSGDGIFVDSDGWTDGLKKFIDGVGDA
jgi:hypothetical protein